MNGKQIRQLGSAETSASLETGQSAPVLPHVISYLGGEDGGCPLSSRLRPLCAACAGCLRIDVEKEETDGLAQRIEVHTRSF